MLPARHRTLIKVLVAALVVMAILVLAVTRFAMELDEELTRIRWTMASVNVTGCALPMGPGQLNDTIVIRQR